MTFSDDLAPVCGDDGPRAHTAEDELLPEERMYEPYEEGQGARCSEVFVHSGGTAERVDSDA